MTRSPSISCTGPYTWVKVSLPFCSQYQSAPSSVRLRNLASLSDAGKAVVVISSYLPEVMALSDRILVAKQGKVVVEFSAIDATQEGIMYAAIH